jgi:hypothetical protein
MKFHTCNQSSKTILLGTHPINIMPLDSLLDKVKQSKIIMPATSNLFATHGISDSPLNQTQVWDSPHEFASACTLQHAPLPVQASIPSLDL